MYMNGTLYKNGDKFKVSYWEGPIGKQELKHIDVHPDSIEEFGDQLKDSETFYRMNHSVEFEIAKKFLDKETLWFAKLKRKDSKKDKRILSLEQEISDAHAYLDGKQINRIDGEGGILSLVERIRNFGVSFGPGPKFF